MLPLCTLILQVIAFLDTGAGKTFVSVLLIRHRMREQRRLAAAAAAAAAAESAAEAAAAPPDAPVDEAAAAAPDQKEAVASSAAESEAPASPGTACNDASMDAPDVIPVHDPSGGHAHRVAVFLAPKVCGRMSAAWRRVVGTSKTGMGAVHAHACGRGCAGGQWSWRHDSTPTQS